MESPKDKQPSRIHCFDIDDYLNQITPRPRLHCLPLSISHFFGYRPRTGDTDMSILSSRPSNLYVWIFAFLGGFIGIAIIENVYLALPNLSDHQAPLIVASFGAAAILEYNTFESPLAQPRNLIVGHLISAVLGVGITKLFQLLPPDRFEELRWLAGALSVGTASAVMAITKTVHPPAGATALLAATNKEITQLGWWLLALILLGSSLMLMSALVINNLYKRFPLYWWTPVDLEQLHKAKNRRREDTSTIANDAEKGEVACSSVEGNSPATIPNNLPQIQWPKSTTFNGPPLPHDDDNASFHSTSELTVINSHDGHSTTTIVTTSPHEEAATFPAPSPSPSPSPLPPSSNSNSNSRNQFDSRPASCDPPLSFHHHQHHSSPTISTSTSTPTIGINPIHIGIPDWLELSKHEIEVLEMLRRRLAMQYDNSNNTTTATTTNT